MLSHALLLAALLASPPARAQDAPQSCISFQYTTKEGTEIVLGSVDPSAGLLQPFETRLRSQFSCASARLIRGDTVPQDCARLIAAAAYRDGGTLFSAIAFDVQVFDRASGQVVWAQSGRGGSGYSDAFSQAAELVGQACASLQRPKEALAPAAAAPAPAFDEDKLRRIVESAMAAKEAPKAQPKPAVRSDADKPLYRLPEDPKRFAVVIGVEKYSDLPPAEFAQRDAEAVRSHLLALGYPQRNIVSLLGERAGKAAFIKTFEAWLARNVGSGASVFVYFSGHGAPDPSSGQAYLMPWDGDPQFLEETAYPVRRLYAKLSELKAKSVLVALDACFSGAGGRSVLARGVRPLVSKVDAGSPTGRVVALSASGADQVSGALPEQGHGLFTYYLLKGLNGAAMDSDGRVTPRSLLEYMTPKVQDEARRQNRTQAPVLAPAASVAAGLPLR